MNVIVADKQPGVQYLNMDAAINPVCGVANMSGKGNFHEKTDEKFHAHTFFCCPLFLMKFFLFKLGKFF